MLLHTRPLLGLETVNDQKVKTHANYVMPLLLPAALWHPTNIDNAIAPAKLEKSPYQFAHNRDKTHNYGIGFYNNWKRLDRLMSLSSPHLNNNDYHNTNDDVSSVATAARSSSVNNSFRRNDRQIRNYSSEFNNNNRL